MIENIRHCCIIAPHPDDETLAMGGTISRLISHGIGVSILIVSGHLPPIYPSEAFDVTLCEAKKAFSIMGVSDYEFLRIPATFVASTPTHQLNQKVHDFIRQRSPELVFVPFPDRHIDHRVIFDSSLVACRPTSDDAPRIVLAYETLSETHWNAPGIEPAFVPDFFIDVSTTIDTKIKALKCYASQVDAVPSRSPLACKALAKFRGSQNGFDYAEAFKTVRIAL